MTLPRRAVLAGLAAGFAAPRAFAQPLSYDVRPVAVGDGVWMVEGATEYFYKSNGGAVVNSAILQGETGLILIDTGPSRRFGEALADACTGLDPRGVVQVFNTHHHPDHFFGNQVFKDRPIHALAETQVAAFEQGEAFADNMYRILGDWMRGTEVTPPTDVIGGGPQVVDGRALRVLALSGHTAGDLALLDETSGILVSGDICFHDRGPTTPNAVLPEWFAALDTVEAAGASAILPGHGPLDPDGASVRQTRDYLTWLETTLRDAAEQGLEMTEVMALPLPERFAAMGAEPEEFRRSVAHLYRGFEMDALPLAD